jgi:hypothetical protein
LREGDGEKLAVAGVDGKEEAVSRKMRKGRDGRVPVFLARAGNRNGNLKVVQLPAPNGGTTDEGHMDINEPWTQLYVHLHKISSPATRRGPNSDEVPSKMGMRCICSLLLSSPKLAVNLISNKRREEGCTPNRDDDCRCYEMGLVGGLAAWSPFPLLANLARA